MSYEWRLETWATRSGVTHYLVMESHVSKGAKLGHPPKFFIVMSVIESLCQFDLQLLSFRVAEYPDTTKFFTSLI